ncbi:hypothetical protein MUCCIDRAFT_114098 [Mucor lusitanicus CBS 277.49]|uniref:Uncharacterized protein n=1 Tax=Mucor lusitanicus CBS 277.49 TaxID=747725 RepID=A0A162QBT0_MUCCL|nr:hypothetical protein MUCCIDRAFT_114098 [Mucor lusitanicus CBS 277.49]
MYSLSVRHDELHRGRLISPSYEDPRCRCYLTSILSTHLRVIFIILYNMSLLRHAPDSIYSFYLDPKNPFGELCVRGSSPYIV